MTKTTIQRIPAEALKFHFGDDASACEFAAAGQDGKIPVKIKARSRGAIAHWYWGQVIHDMAGMKLSKPKLPLDYCHRDDEILGAVDRFDAESGDLVAEGFLDSADERAAEIARKARMGVPYEASIFFDPRTLEAERLSDKETATVNGVTVRGPVTIIRKWTLRGVAVCPYGYDPKTSTRFSQDDGDVDVTLLSHNSEAGGSTMPVDQKNQEAGKLSEGAGNEQQPQTPPAGSGDLSQQPKKPDGKPAEKPGELASQSGQTPPAGPPAGSTELGAGKEPEKTPKPAPGQAYIDRFGLEKGAVYFAQGLSMEEAMSKHMASLADENTQLKARIEAAKLGSDDPVSFAGEGAKGAMQKEKGSGDPAMDAFCANTKLPGQKS